MAAIPGSSAFACGGILDVACNVTHGGLDPGHIFHEVEHAGQDVGKAVQQAGQDVGNALNELQANVLTGPALEQAIISSHNTAVNGSMPIPPEIRQQLTGYASEDSMNRVRFKIGDNGFVNLAHLLEQGGLADAVTLIDVIVFRGPSEASDPAIWAHELVHVDQYGAGVHSFAVRYTRNWRSIEEPAYAKQDGFWNWRQQQDQQDNQAGVGGGQSMGDNRIPGITGPITPVGLPPGLGAFCYVQGYRFGPGPVQPLGNQCFVDIPQGHFVGQVGP